MPTTMTITKIKPNADVVDKIPVTIPDTIPPKKDINGYLVDPGVSYEFSAPGVEPRTIKGEGTKVMLAHAHPGATFKIVGYVEKAIEDMTEKEFDDIVADGDAVDAYISDFEGER